MKVSFTATNGPANGMTSTDIGIAEKNNAAVGSSLQLVVLYLFRFYMAISYSYL
jgi:hypothetical protein